MFCCPTEEFSDGQSWTDHASAPTGERGGKGAGWLPKRAGFTHFEQEQLRVWGWDDVILLVCQAYAFVGSVDYELEK